MDCHVFLARHDVFSNPKERYKVWHSEFAVVGSEILFLKTKGEAIGAPTRTAPCAFTAIPKEKKVKRLETSLALISDTSSNRAVEAFKQRRISVNPCPNVMLRAQD